MPSSTREGGPSTWSLIAVPAALTLAVTMLRLFGLIAAAVTRNTPSPDRG